jgi:hypothetical protein
MHELGRAALKRFDIWLRRAEADNVPEKNLSLIEALDRFGDISRTILVQHLWGEIQP